ncbi:vesicle coat component [Exophiala dermatitidis]|nr:vesicle coat component [Exophiala dermatitidis]
MEASDNSSHDTSHAGDSVQSGHWLPALRPEVLDETRDESHAGTSPETKWTDKVNVETNLIPPTTVSTQQTTDVAPGDGAPAASSTTQPETSREKQQAAGSTLNEAQAPQTHGRAGEDDELPSEDDDERLDPAWGIKRTDTAHILDNVHRSTTFPSFPSSEPADTQAGTTAQHPPEPTFDGKEEEVRATEHSEPNQAPQTLDWPKDNDGADTETLPWAAPQEAEAVDEAAQRFDEGVPLIQTNGERAADQDHIPADSGVSAFDTTADDEEASFFSNINNSASAPENPPLDRKSTDQVLDSLHFSAKEKSGSGSPPEPEEHSFFDELAQAKDEPPTNPPTEDVDAMWAAALGDDEFLVEDAGDLLPDSEPSSPSSFIASLQQSSTVPDEKPDLSQPQPPVDVSMQQTQPFTQRSANPYAPHQPSTSDLFQLSLPAQTTHNTVGLSRPGIAPLVPSQSNVQQEAPPQPAKSFVDQKDGYKSPYDLPLDIAKPRKRAHIPHPVQTTKSVAPPPRSSSLTEPPLLSPFSPYIPQAPATGGLPPQRAPAAVPPRRVSAFEQPAKPERPKSGSGSGPSHFFEELPITFKPRHGSGHGHHTPLPHSPIPPPQGMTQGPPSLPMSPPQQQTSPARAPDPYAQYQLRSPERIDPYAHVSSEPSPQPAPSASAARYSPAPVGLAPAHGAGPTPRYSPAPPPQTGPSNVANRYASKPTPTPPTQPPPMAQSRYVSQPPPHPPSGVSILPFQPRTSSPLAYHKSALDDNADGQTPAMGQLPKPRQGSTTGYFPPQNVAATDGTSFANPARAASPPRPPPVSERLPPPQRSQTQSPSRQRSRPGFPTYNTDVINRPASAYGQPLPSRNVAEFDPIPPRPDVHPRGLAPELEFVRPSDDTQFDPLERWKGAPVFKFGFGGSIVSTFPKHVPRYTAGAGRPQIKASPGDVATRSTKDVLPQADRYSSFPGPLRTKSKKKELLAWMSNYISSLEASTPDAAFSQSLPDMGRRHHEKVLLWKIVRALVEHDGNLDGPALKAVNEILTPEVHALDELNASQYHGDEHLSGIYRPAGGNVRPDSVDPMAVEVLRKRLLSGDRQAAVTHAMDNRLWSHALVISSTMDRSAWSQVVREFVRQEVKTVGANAESLSALYEIFGGNLEESIDELVPPSARAGLQMVSRVDPVGPTKNALDGLNRWKETLSLVLNNRCQGDHQALAVLGKLLEDYNRIEAAHICYLFSRNPARPIIVGGLDDEQTPVVLLGADHRAQPFDFGRDQEAILLTEIYEFATSVLSAGSPLPFMHHLSVYKLQRATALAEAGFRTEAQSYCDAIAATFKPGTKMSPYYHPLFLSELDDLLNRLKQMPNQGSSSWIGKPSLEKVSGSVWNKFSSFVVGEDSDAESKGSGKDAAEAGPFAHVSGTPTISRQGSQSDLYGSYPQNMSAAGSRYAPNGIQSTRSSSELTRGRPSLDGRVSLDQQRSPPSTSYSRGSRQYEPTNMFQSGPVVPPSNPYQAALAASPPKSTPQSPPRSSYLPNSIGQALDFTSRPRQQQTQGSAPPAKEATEPPYGYRPEPMTGGQNREARAYGGYMPVPQERSQTPAREQEDTNHNYQGPSSQSFSYEPQPQVESNNDAYKPSSQSYGYEPSQREETNNSGYEPPSQSYGYEPPTQSYGYEPPSGDDGYVPYEPEPDSPVEEKKESKPKKKSFMDDDDDDFPPITAKPSQPAANGTSDDDEAARKRANDAAAEAAFKAAAEADAARAKEKEQQKRSSSWFSGWLGSKKSAEGLDSGNKGGAEPKVYKANLGESKMKLYYDKELGKWVNPDNPDAAKKSATPPPPRMGGTPAPPMGPGGHSRTPGSGPTSNPNLPGLGIGMPPPSGPGSRAGTPASGHGPGNSTAPTPSPLAGLSGPPSGAGTPPLPASNNMSQGSLAPPPGPGSRPGTATSNASSIDDLIGPATGRKGPKGGKRGGKAGRYVDVMAK